MVEFYDCVSPGSRAEDVADVSEGAAEDVFLFVGGDVVAEGAAGPGRAVVEEWVEDFDGFLQHFVGGFEWGAVVAGFGRDGGDIVGD